MALPLYNECTVEYITTTQYGKDIFETTYTYIKDENKTRRKAFFLLKIYTLPADKTKNNVFKATVPQKMHASNSKTVYTYKYGDSC